MWQKNVKWNVHINKVLFSYQVIDVSVGQRFLACEARPCMERQFKKQMVQK